MWTNLSAEKMLAVAKVASEISVGSRGSQYWRLIALPKCLVTGLSSSASTCAENWIGGRTSTALGADLDVGDKAQRDGGDVERVGDEVEDVPHVMRVLVQAAVPELLDLDPDQAKHPGHDGPLDRRGRRPAALLDVGVLLLAAPHTAQPAVVVEALAGQDEQNCGAEYILPTEPTRCTCSQRKQKYDALWHRNLMKGLRTNCPSVDLGMNR